MDTFEIHDEEVNVEEIMNKIRENISKRKAHGTYPPELDAASKHSTGDKKCAIGEIKGEIADDLLNLKINCDIQNNSYIISSHRPIVGIPLTKSRKLVHGEVRRYVDPMVFKQTTFNQYAAKILNDAVYRLSSMENVIGETKCQHSSRSKNLQQITKENYERLLDLQSETDERLLDIEDKIEALKQETKDETILNTKMCELVDQLRADMENSLSKLRTEMVDPLRTDMENSLSKLRTEMVDPLRTDMENSLSRLRTEMKKDNEAMISSFIAAMDMDIEKKAWLAQVLDKRNLQGISQAEKLLKPPQLDSGVNYFVFEDKFRGAREDVAQRQTAFLRYFEGCKNVLDIGCGRGEFLQTMREHGIGARGVDLDETMVDYCHAKGLEVQLDDAFEYMEKLDDASLDGIFIDQVVEHLEPSYLIRLLDLCFKKMKYGFYLIAETVNPLSFSSFANFYIDLTHIKPVHPETLRFLFESTGFREIKTVFSSPVPDSLRLQKLVTSEVANDTEKYQIEVYNRNIEMLNTTLYGAQDYAMIGKK